MNGLAKKLFVLIIFVSSFLIFGSIFSYDDKTTHPALTDEIVDFYNLYYPNDKLTSEEKEWIIQGSIDEDTPPRWINHFYDPIYQNGWSGEKTGILPQNLVQYFSEFGLSSEKPVSSLDWLNNQTLQAKYGQYKGNRTWKRAIYELAKNKNKKEAYYTLGFILHLIEDATVPDHTRNDTHAHELRWATKDYGSPYEEYLKQYKRDNLNVSKDLFNQGEKPIILNSIDDYLISLAQYSNKYFFSKDTINDPKYQYPKIIREDENFGYGRDENGIEFPLVKIVKMWSSTKKDYEVKYLLEKNEPAYYPILSAYFSRLSKKAILSGAGIIKLFKEEVAKAENENLKEPIKDSASIWSLTGQLYQVIDWLSQQYSNIKENLSSAIGLLTTSQINLNNPPINTNTELSNANIGNSSLTLENSASQNLTNQTNPNIPSINTNIKPNNNTNTDNQTTPINQTNQNNQRNQQNQLIIANNQKNSTNQINPFQQPSLSARILVLAGPDIIKSQTNTNQENEEPQQEQEPTSTPTFLEPPTILTNNGQDFITASSTIILEGTKPEISEIFINDSNENIIYFTSPQNLATGPTSTLWQKEIALNLDENIFIVKAKNNEIESTTTSIKIIFDNSGPNQIIDLISNPGEKIGEILLTFSRPTDNYTNISKYLIKINDGINETEQEFLLNNSTTTSAIETYLFKNLNPEKTYTFTIFSFDEFNQKSEPSNQTSSQPQVKTDHLVINEVQIQKKEFIELYNPTNQDIDLSNFYFAIYSKNDDWHDPNNLKQFPTNTKISANGYFLIGLFGFSTSTADWQPYTSNRLNNSNGAVAIFSKNPKEILSATSTPEEINQIKIDAFGWGSPKIFEASPKSEIAKNYQSFERKFLAYDTDNNQNNFVISDPTPTNSKNQTFKERIKWVLELNNENEPESPFSYSTLSPNKTLFVYSINTLFAIDINGNLLWKKKINSQNFITFFRPIADSQDSVYIANSLGELYKFDKNGNQIWKINLNQILILNLTLSQDENTLYLTANNKLISLNSQTGSINWDYEFLGNTIYFQKPAISQKTGNIYLLNTSSLDPTLYIFSSATSTSIQTLNLSEYLNSQSTYSSIEIDNQNNNEILYFGSTKQLLIINPETNKILSKDISEFNCNENSQLQDSNLKFNIGKNVISISQNNFISFTNGNSILRTFSKEGEINWFYCLDLFETHNFSLIDENDNIIFTTTKWNYQNNLLQSKLISFTKDGEINWEISSDELEFNLILNQPILSDNLILLVVKEINQNKIINKIIALKNDL